MSYKLPIGWKAEKLGNIIDLTMGQSPASKYYNEDGIGIPFMQGNTTFGKRYPKINRFTTKVTRVANKNDILMSVRAPVGDLNILDISKVCIGRGLCSMRMNNNMQNFLYYLMKFNMEQLQNRESGTVFSSVNKKDIVSLPIDMPPLEEQKAIADTLSALDDKIELNNKINKNLEEQAQLLFKHWFVDFEFPNEEGLPYKSNGGEMIDSELGMIPKGWEIDSLGKSNLGKLKTSGIEEFEGEKIYLATADISDTRIVNESTKVTLNDKPSIANMHPTLITYGNAKMKDNTQLILVYENDYRLQNRYILSTGFTAIQATKLSVY